ncbi:ankyrin repeat-containing domain protein [Flagelloscypha sp. PMI_526]|nr:ankyrin repeat-containing domain protein [Flagelloscypha sp. PMI_526]
MCSVSSNPSVARVCGQALSGLLPGPGDTHQRGVNQAWLRLQEKQRQTVTSSLIRLYPLVWRQVEDEAHSFHRFDELFENLVDCFSPSYNPWIRAEALLRSWIIRFGDPHDSRIGCISEVEGVRESGYSFFQDLSEFILQSSRVVKPSNSFELPWSLSDLPDLDFSTVFAQQGDTGTLERVLPFTSNVNLTSELHAGRRPLHVAAAEDTAFRVALRLGQLEVARFLLPFTPDSDLQRPFRRPEEGVVKSVSLLHHTSWIGEMRIIERPLFMASKQGHTEIVTLLLDSSADPHLFGNWHTPLTVACQYGHGDVASLLLDMPGMDPNMQPVLSEAHAHARRGETALHSASRGGSAEVVLVLLEWGADPHILDARGRSPRDIALMYDYEKIFNLLDLYDLPW